MKYLISYIQNDKLYIKTEESNFWKQGKMQTIATAYTSKARKFCIKKAIDLFRENKILYKFFPSEFPTRKDPKIEIFE